METKFTVAFIPIQSRLWDSRRRVLGEIDKFLLEELPVDKLLFLVDESKENFAKALQLILHRIGTDLAKRLSTSPLYYLYPIEDLIPKWQSVHSPAYWYDFWTETAFLVSISGVWDKVAFDEKFTKGLIKVLQKAPLSQDKTLYLYGILVYARTLYEQKGGKWNDIYPLLI